MRYADWKSVGAALAAIIALALTPAGGSWAQTQYALVVGIADYGGGPATPENGDFFVPGPLPNAVRDARLIADSLRETGFETTLVENPTRRQLLQAINNFARDLYEDDTAELGLFYFAGHGAQGVPPLERNIENFIIPREAVLASEVDLADEALGLSRISATLSNAGVDATVIILDACRNFALPAANRSGAVTRGLAEASAAPGTLIAYSTAPGRVATDGPAGGHSPYAAALAREFRGARGARLEDIFISVREDVLAATNRAQTPWENASLTTRIVLGQPEPAGASDTGVSRAAAAVNQTRAVPNARRLAPNHRAPVTTPSADIDDFGVFRECPDCPEMVMIPPGSFLRGSPPDERGRRNNESPRERVFIRPGFAIGRFEVTQGQWRACVLDGFCPRRGPDVTEETARLPITGVSYEDIIVGDIDTDGFLAWLNSKAGADVYRLPSEAEWEYAARGGSASAYWWGERSPVCEEDAIGGARFDDDRGCDDIGPALVGTYARNGFGLFDVAGNVWEWTEDCWTGDYVDAPIDARARLDGDCDNRAVRGGSWVNLPQTLRSAARNDRKVNRGRSFIGFRVARTMTVAP